MITFLNFGTPFNASKRDKAPKPSNYIVVTCHQRLKFRIFSTNIFNISNIGGIQHDIGHRLSINENFSKISIILVKYQPYIGLEVKKSSEEWRAGNLLKYRRYIGKYIGYIIEKACQNIKDISTIYRIYRIYRIYIGEILDIF